MKNEKLQQAYDLIIEAQGELLKEWNEKETTLYDVDFEKQLKELRAIANSISNASNK